MTAKRFILDWEFPDHAGLGYEVIKDNQTKETLDVELYNVLHKLNQMEDEKQHIKFQIQEAYNNERTELGKSVLKQLIETIGA